MSPIAVLLIVSVPPSFLTMVPVTLSPFFKVIWSAQAAVAISAIKHDTISLINFKIILLALQLTPGFFAEGLPIGPAVREPPGHHRRPTGANDRPTQHPRRTAASDRLRCKWESKPLQAGKLLEFISCPTLWPLASSANSQI